MDQIMKNIIRLRKTKGLSQEKFSEKLGVSRETIRKWESGKSIPNGKNLNTICKVFNVTLKGLSDENAFEEDNKIKIAIDELKTDLKENLKTDLKADIKEDLKSDLKEDLRTDLKADIKEDLRTDLKADIKEDLRTDLKADIKEDLRTDLKADIKEDLKTDLKADIKKDLRTDLKVDIKEDLRTDLKTDIKKDLRADLKTDIKEEHEKTSKERKIAIIKKLRNIVLILLICISLIYVGCSVYKFNVLTQIGEKVSKYKNLDNYYCEIQTYKGDFLREKEEIWYKDKIYKIEKTIYNDIGQPKAETVTIINLKDNILTTDNNGNYKMEWKIQNKEKYENGSYMYNLFPDEIKNDFKTKIDNAFKLNILKTKTIKEKNIFRLGINLLKVDLDNELFTPIFYTNGENNNNSRKEFTIKLDCVKNKDISI